MLYTNITFVLSNMQWIARIVFGDFGVPTQFVDITVYFRVILFKIKGNRTIVINPNICN